MTIPAILFSAMNSHRIKTAITKFGIVAERDELSKNQLKFREYINRTWQIVE